MTIDHRELFFQPGISPTSINYFFESPSRFWKYSSYNPNRVKTEATEAMIFGRLVHCLVLTPEMHAVDFAVEPVKEKDDLDTNAQMAAFLTPLVEAQGSRLKKSASKDELIALLRQLAPQAPIWQDKMDFFKKTIGRKTSITQEQQKTAESMRDAMMANRAVKNLIGNGLSESPFCWHPDGPDGLMRKCRLDYVRAGLVIEYKTDVDPGEADFSRTLFDKRGYHRQLATQVEAATLLNGERPKGAIAIVQDKEMHDDIAIWALEASDIQMGNEENAFAMNEIKRRMATMKAGASERDAWRTFPEEIRIIKRPRWYKQKGLQETA